MTRSRLLAASVWLLPLGCGGGVSFSGRAQAPVVEPSQLESGDRAPEGQHRLGTVKAHCQGVDVSEGLESASLSEVSCSVPFLVAALRERAATVGGSFLMEPRCDVANLESPRMEVSCHSELWGPSDPSAFASVVEPLPVNVDAAGPAAPGVPSYGHVEEAWRVRVDFHPVAGWAARAPLLPDGVNEVDFPRVNEAPQGDLVAYCEGDAQCAVASVRGALSAAAARLGANTVVGVRCVTEEGSPRCVATAAVVLVDEAGRAGPSRQAAIPQRTGSGRAE
jgi:hypothetical protein